MFRKQILVPVPLNRRAIVRGDIYLHLTWRVSTEPQNIRLFTNAAKEGAPPRIGPDDTT